MQGHPRVLGCPTVPMLWPLLSGGRCQLPDCRQPGEVWETQCAHRPRRGRGSALGGQAAEHPELPERDGEVGAGPAGLCPPGAEGTFGRDGAAGPSWGTGPASNALRPQGLAPEEGPGCLESVSEVSTSVMRLKLEVEEKKQAMALLQRALAQQRDLTVRRVKETEKELGRQLRQQREHYEATIQRHLSFIDQVTPGKWGASGATGPIELGSVFPVGERCAPSMGWFRHAMGCSPHSVLPSPAGRACGRSRYVAQRPLATPRPGVQRDTRPVPFLCFLGPSMFLGPRAARAPQERAAEASRLPCTQPHPPVGSCPGENTGVGSARKAGAQRDEWPPETIRDTSLGSCRCIQTRALPGARSAVGAILGALRRPRGWCWAGPSPLAG